MPSNIPFIYNENDVEILKTFYSDTKCVRISLEKANILNLIPSGISVWIDPNVDIYHNWPPSENKLKDLYSRFDPEERISDINFQKRPNEEYLCKFINSILDHCNEYGPGLLTVPQLPLMEKPNRNAINKKMVELSKEWQHKNHYSGKLILPIIICNQSLINRKPLRDKIIEHARMSLDIFNMTAIWVVDVTLNDNLPFNTYGDKRFPSLIELHKGLQKEIPPHTKIIAGPYWGMNLLLWARGLATHMAFGLGKGYQYLIPGGKKRRGHNRIALGPLRRMSVVEKELEAWLKIAKERISYDQQVVKVFDNLLQNMKKYYSDNYAAQKQVAEFYKEWIGSFDSLPPEGRALALYQDFSNAFVLGKKIKKPLPRSAKSARAPEKVVQQYMLNTL
ncbi:MAG: hypothetical protein CVT49_09575 [candidate division Zixibacteria bacterium HGW-Zixibacteria-1]|nr:MAG: hypothetical protein CVT49_09575 [candidate division Zixibacteria bacterium HGW-Zixibacteria-1]